MQTFLSIKITREKEKRKKKKKKKNISWRIREYSNKSKTWAIVVTSAVKYLGTYASRQSSDITAFKQNRRLFSLASNTLLT